MDAERKTERSRLDLVVGAVLQKTALDPGDNISCLAAALAVDELLAMDLTRPGSWRLRGLAEGYGLFDEPTRAPTEALERQRLAGLLDGAAQRGDHERVAAEALAHPSLTEALVAGEYLQETASILEALLPERPRWALDLMSLAPGSFALWDHFAHAVARRADGQAGDLDPDDGHALIESLRGTLERWAAADAVAADALRRVLRAIATTARS